MEILFATGNLHKKEEMGKILAPHTIKIPKDLGIDFDVEETGNSYLENSFLKAKYLYDKTKMVVLADDSGLSVAALDGAPGLYSARFGDAEAGRKLTQKEKNSLIIDLIKNKENRDAFFVCCLTLILDEYRHYTVQEQFTGKIIDKESGSGGFGYDPIFYLNDYNKTVAEITDSEKNKISHRAKAGIAMKRIIDTL